MSIDWKGRTTWNDTVLAGKPTIPGLRISVEQVLRGLADGVREAEILADYPDLEADDLRACQAYAAELIASERDFPIRVGA